VLVNLAFAAWSAWFAPSEHVGRPVNEGLPALTLVSEVPADLHSGAAAEIGAGGEEPVTTEQASAETETRCTSVGPFRELAQAAAAAATLRGEGYQPQQRVAEGEVWSGYWVYIPAIPTELEANETLAKVREGVREARIPDAYVIRNSDSGNLVSLGVFSEISGVSRLRDEVRALGFEPQVVDRMSRATVYWIDIALAPEQALDFDALQPPGRIIRLEQRACDSTPN
jgi:hypothetical protein